MNHHYFPDGSRMDAWFSEYPKVTAETLGKQYRFDEYGIKADGTVQTQAIQSLIDRAYEEGGGVLVVTEGCFLSGALYFRQNVHLDRTACISRRSSTRRGSKASVSAAKEPLMETGSNTGRISGSEGSGILPAPIKIRSAPGWFIWRSVPMCW